MLDPISGIDFEIALAFLVACQATSAVLMQRILELVFGRAWWTYALALAWAISVIYLPTIAFFSSGLLTIASITATLASIHGYLCWRATGKRAWLIWSLVAMLIGLAFYIKALLIPVYLLLMRVLLLDPEARLRDSVRAAAQEWRVWLAYAALGAAYLLIYLLGDYQRVRTGATVADLVRYVRIFWLEGFWPMVFGVRVRPFEHEAWHHLVIIATQLALAGIVAWSVVRRRAAWRAWAFLLVVIAANLLIVVGRVTEFGPDAIGYYVRYYSEAAVFVPIALAFAFAAPGKRGESLKLPRARSAAAALALLAAYVCVTLVTTDRISRPTSTELFNPDYDNARASGRLARGYFENLRAGLDAERRSGGQFALLDHDVPEWAMSGFFNIAPPRPGFRYTALSNVLPLFDEQVTFNQLVRLYVRATRRHPAAHQVRPRRRRVG